jgi:hypothetical protein
MGDLDTKPKIPAYVSYKTFYNFLNGLRESGVPAQIDKSMMTAMSGSGQSAMIGSLEFLKLIDSNGQPAPELQQLVDSEENNRGAILRSVLEGSYPFLFGGTIDLKRATTKQVEEAFRSQGISGSTVVKCIAFFLAAAKTAGIQVSPHVKTPALVRNPVKRGGQGGLPDDRGADVDADEDDDGDAGTTRRLKLPLLGKPDVTLIVPADFNADDWKFLKPIFELYMERMLKDQQ